MADLRTTITELVTGLGMLGHATLEDALASRPAEMVSMSPQDWDTLGAAYEGGGFGLDFERAWENGRAFLESTDGLRGRVPLTVEWKGSQRAPGDEVAPVDLRIDHVFMVSCKYLSKITINSAPAHLFDRLLSGGHGRRGGDWFNEVAPEEHQLLYEAVLADLCGLDLPERVEELSSHQRALIAKSLRQGWPRDAKALYERLADQVSSRSVERWRAAIGISSAEGLLWRMLRIGSAPYFVLGATGAEPMRLRVATPWDWRLHYKLKEFTCAPQRGGQSRVSWFARVEERYSQAIREIHGHVEIRWSHGRFASPPEAKVYLDTPHKVVPGYYAL